MNFLTTPNVVRLLSLSTVDNRLSGQRLWQVILKAVFQVSGETLAFFVKMRMVRSFLGIAKVHESTTLLTLVGNDPYIARLNEPPLEKSSFP